VGGLYQGSRSEEAKYIALKKKKFIGTYAAPSKSFVELVLTELI
jgi:hypothetical protein